MLFCKEGHFFIMQSVKVVGVTGGIGAGKSVVCKVFSCLGVPCYNSDVEAKLLVNSDIELRNTIKKEFGDSAYKDGQYQARYIAEIVFNDAEKMKVLNAIIHPAVKKHFLDWKDRQASQLVLKETAILFQANLGSSVDYIVLVDAPEDLRVSRTLTRDSQRSLGEVKAIIEKQGYKEEWKQKADFVVLNDGKHSLTAQVADILNKIEIEIR